jgi:DNA-binding NtrC family response regulator
MPIYLPPLRERLQDLEALVYHFIEQFNQLHQRHIKGVTPEALEKMKNYPWPGNIRELENAIEYSFIIETTDHVQKESLPPSVLTGAAISPSGAVIDSAYRMNKETFERDFIVQALKQNKGRINQTAENAGIPKNTLLRKIKKYGISAKDYGDSSDESE